MDKWLRNTNVVRIVALVIGILLWVVVHMEETNLSGNSPLREREETINNVAITAKYDETHYHISSMAPANVQVIVKGKESSVKKVTTSNSYQIELDLTQVGKGDHQVALKPVGFPSDVDVQIVPRTVHVVIEELQMKEVPVVINVKGTPAAGLKAGQPIVKPAKVYITAQTSKLDQIENVRGEVSVDKAQSAVTKQVRLQAFDKDGKEVTLNINPSVVDVEVPITSPFQTIPLQMKISGEPPKGFAIAMVTQNPDKVTVFGTQDVVDRLEFYQGPQLNVQDLNETREFALDIPLRNKVTQLDPAKVTVHVEIVPSITKALENVPITIIGQNENYNTKVTLPETAKLNITVEGAPALIDQLKVQDVQAILDVSNLPPGKHELKVTLNLPTYVKLGMPQEVKATVEISEKAPK
ncbi:CdaR family protein [Paenibacillus alginolyticus]|uniref:CdaR family protein n=1 Tax=Paenibacillus alginolyticus TaxID=59839 RepID=A0ABT4GIV4_9BACL|nr:CdaR family protein [Paenibacillus alginolyticus]MCY9666553.1 CdaR family protein [Paenibacillus alginolyticus]MCY9696137.1 CdaR family protein [Paenibacillus alginolyticus]MEC0143290.1 CdaR family protein [Paenibacillus alginolyticus]